MEAFAAGLRVLVVDDDLAWLRILEKMLKKCSYEVTTCCLAREALHVLRERKDGFDIVISDVNMPDMDGFKLLEHVGLEMDLPVIMMSVDGETSRVMRGVQHGACDYLLKPIRMKELRNIWQHVLKKKAHKVRYIESYEKLEEYQMMRSATKKKGKDRDNNCGKSKYGYSSFERKIRVAWTVDLHQKFVTAVNKIGIDKVGPKKILDLMSVPKLTRENVASHLQKYRLYLSRLQKGNDSNVSFGAIKQTDLPLTDPFGSVALQNFVNLQQMNSKQTLSQKTDPKFHDNDMKSIVLLPIQEPNKPSFRNISDTPKTSSSRMCPIPNFKSLEPNVKYDPFDRTVPETNVWNEIPKEQFNIENVFNHVDRVPFFQSVNSRPFIAEKKKETPIETETQEKVSKVAHLLPIRVSEPITSSSIRSNNHLFLHDSRSVPEVVISESCLDFTSSNEDLFSLVQSDGNYKTNVELQHKEFFKPNIPDLFAETAGYPYQLEATEYPMMDQGHSLNHNWDNLSNP